MIKIFDHRSVIVGIVLLTFFFSANCLLYGSHAAEVMLSEATQIVGNTHDSTSLSGHHRSSHHHNHSHRSHPVTEDCGAHGHHGHHGHHSHDFRSEQPLVVSPASSFSQRRFFEIYAYIPEVYLDRFIPPQNPA